MGLVMAVYLYTIDSLALLYYSDSVSHLVRARQLVDSSSPGLQQIGTVWLPLPHIILLPFSLVEVLLKTGFAGTVVSLPGTTITAAIIYKIVKNQTAIPWIAFFGACLYFSNPNILYLGLTAMTESLFMLLFVISAFYFQKCSSMNILYTLGQRYTSTDLTNQFHLIFVNRHRILILKPLLKCSFFVALVTLCRYEAWPISIFLVLFGFVFITRLKTSYKTEEAPIFPGARMQLKSGIVFCILVSFSGIIIWMSYNSIYFANPVEFVVSPYYSAFSQAIEGQNRETLFLQPLNVAYIYGINAATFFGPVMIAGAAVGYAVHRKSSQKGGFTSRELTYVFLSIPSITIILALLFGLGEMNSWWYNSRFLIMLSPLLILLLSVFVTKILEIIQSNKTMFAGIIAAFFLLYPIIVVPIYGGFVTLIDAKNSAYNGTRSSAMSMVEFLKDLYNGGNILIITGSAQQNIVMQASGIPLTNFKTAIEGSNIHYELQRVVVDSQYVILSKDPDPSSQRHAESWTKNQDGLKRFFVKAYENSQYIIFVRNDQ
jgi:hypothetical protein